MKINSIDAIDSDGGDWLVLTDWGTEGLSVTSQHKTPMEAILSLGENGTGMETIVLLPDLFIEHIAEKKMAKKRTRCMAGVQGPHEFFERKCMRKVSPPGPFCWQHRTVKPTKKLKEQTNG